MTIGLYQVWLFQICP